MKKTILKLLCRLGFHNYGLVSTGSLIPGDKCKRCKIVRQFTMFGEPIYGWDVNDLPDHIPPPNEKSTII